MFLYRHRAVTVSGLEVVRVRVPQQGDVDAVFPFAPHPVAERRAEFLEMALALPVVVESVFADILLASVGFLGPGERRPADDAVVSLVDGAHQFAARIEQRVGFRGGGHRLHPGPAVVLDRLPEVVEYVQFHVAVKRIIRHR